MLQLTNLSLGIIISIVTFLCTLYVTSYTIRKLLLYGHTVPDMYKRDRPAIPSFGGLAIMAGVMIGVVMTELLVDAIDIDRFLIFYMVVIVFGVFGMMDDLTSIGRRIKTFAPFFMALPIAMVTTDTNISLLFYNLELGSVYPYIFAPIYVMVVANLINMHSGYNGLAGGLTLIMLGFAALKLAIVGPMRLLFYMIPLFFALAAFMWYNRYPSRIFLGNVGASLIGAGLGAMLVFFNLEFFGIIILIPHIVNFVLWILWLFLMKRYPNKYPHVKFGRLRENETIEAPNLLTVKYIVSRSFRLTEKHATWALYGLTGLFGIIGVVWF